MTPSDEDGTERRVDEDVEAAEAATVRPGPGDGFAAANVDRGAGGELSRSDGLQLIGYAGGGGFVAVGYNNVGAAAAASRATSRPMPLAPPTTRAMRRLSSFSGAGDGFLLLPWPRFDAEGFNGGQGDVVGEDFEAGGVVGGAALGRVL